MPYDLAGDNRLDPRLKALLSFIPPLNVTDVASREEMIAEANTEKAHEGAELFRTFMDLCDTEETAPSAGLYVHTEKIVSEPDGNTINLRSYDRT